MERSELVNFRISSGSSLVTDADQEQVCPRLTEGNYQYIHRHFPSWQGEIFQRLMMRRRILLPHVRCIH